ncbi:MAG: PDZ domain-containing protein [Chloroflexota bacterium]|nr:PDZ domain-containing protein [Chloroflexota bacterium]
MKRYVLWVPVLVALLVVGSGLAGAPVVLAQEGEEEELVAEADLGTVAALEGVLQAIYDEVNPSVVNIQVAGMLSPVPIVPETPGLPVPPGPEGPIFGGGSGFVWDDEGHIVTNNHVIENASAVYVSFAEGTTVEAEVVGMAPDVDLAVLQVDVPPEVLPEPVSVAESPTLRVGQLAIAIGNPFGQAGTMTLGIISALGRLLPVSDAFGLARFSIPDIIQTDAAINPGSSGGVLLNESGELIGVTTAIFSPVQASVGIGFAIPSYIVEDAVPALIETGEFELPYLGVQGATLTPAIAQEMGLEPTQRGALITSVVPDGPAAEAGLQGGEREATILGRPIPVGGDVIIAIEGEPVTDFDDVITYLARNAEVGETIELTILRDGEEETVEVTLEARPEQEAPPPMAGVQPQQPQLGILGLDVVPEIAAAMELPEDQQGVLVQSVEMGSPADEAGIMGGFTSAVIRGQPVLLGGDVIVEFNGEAIAGIEELRAALAEVEPGEAATITVLRDGEEVDLEVTFPEREAEAEPVEEGAPQGRTLGIVARNVTPEIAEELELPEEQGILVEQVREGTPAANAGILEEDVIIGFNDEEITSISELRTALQEVEPGEEVTITVLRDGEEEEVEVSFAEEE